MTIMNKGFLIRARHAVLSALSAAALATLAALQSCAPSSGNQAAKTDLPYLKNWLAAVRRQVAAGATAPPSDQTNQTDQAQPAGHGGRIISDSDPFAPRIHKPVTPPATQQADASESAALHMLGTIRDGGIAYALIKADKQVFCVATHATLPSYPVTVAGIADQAVELDHLSPNGRHRRSTLRLGE